jgi:NAD(P)-dependent dehydrogenase (short-subunit alcohol dehydrogenase family)
MGLVNCAGIAPAEKTVGKNGAHNLGLFTKTIMVNLVGSFNMIRLAAEAMARTSPSHRRARLHDLHRFGRGLRRPDRPGGVQRLQGRRGRHDAADRPRPGPQRHPQHDHRPGIFGTPMLFGMPQEVQDALAASVPFPSRLGTPQDYAKLAKHIFENDMLNGEVIRLDGAIRLAPK